MLTKKLTKFGIMLMGLFLVLMTGGKAYAANSISVNTYYEWRMYEGLDTEFSFSIQENGRVKFFIEDCTSNLDSISYDSRRFDGYIVEKDSDKYLRDRFDLHHEGEIYYSDWCTVTPGEYTYIIEKIPDLNKEAKLRIEYQKSDAYNGEIEPNDSYINAYNLKFNVNYEGDIGYLGDSEDIYKIVMEHTGLLTLNVKDRKDGGKIFTVIEEDIHENVTELGTYGGEARLRIPKGVYYIEISSGYSRSNYSQFYGYDVAYKEEYIVKAVATYEKEDTCEIEYNNIKSAANKAQINKWYNGNFNTDEDIDYFQFTVPGKSLLSMELKVPRQIAEGKVKIALYDSNLKLLIPGEDSNSPWSRPTTINNTSNPYLKTEAVVAGAGTYYIRLEGSLNDSDYQICLNVQPVPITINKSKADIKVGNSVTLKLDNADNSVKWTSQNSSIASVSSKGEVKGKGVGTTTITGEYKGKTYSCKVTVNSKFKKGAWYVNGWWYVEFKNIKGNKMKVSMRMPNKTFKNKTATIKKDGKTATLKIKCGNKKTHTLTFSISGDNIKATEKSSCAKKIIRTESKNKKTKVKQTFYPEGE